MCWFLPNATISPRYTYVRSLEPASLSLPVCSFCLNARQHVTGLDVQHDWEHSGCQTDGLVSLLCLAVPEPFLSSPRSPFGRRRRACSRVFSRRPRAQVVGIAPFHKELALPTLLLSAWAGTGCDPVAQVTQVKHKKDLTKAMDLVFLEVWIKHKRKRFLPVQIGCATELSITTLWEAILQFPAWPPEPILAAVILNLCLKIPLGDGGAQLSRPLGLDTKRDASQSD